MCVIHPDAQGVIESPKFGGIRTEKGPLGYLVSIASVDPVTGFTHYKTEKVTI